MSIKDDLNGKNDHTKSPTCKAHNSECPEEMEKPLTGVVGSFRRLDGLPLVDSEDGMAIIIKDFKIKPEMGQEIKYVITAAHGSVTYGKRIED